MSFKLKKDADKVICKIDLNTGKPVVMFNTYLEACLDAGLSKNSTANIERACSVYGWCTADGKSYTKGNIIRGYGYCFLKDFPTFKPRHHVTVSVAEAKMLYKTLNHISNESERCYAYGKAIYALNGIEVE